MQTTRLLCSGRPGLSSRNIFHGLLTTQKVLSTYIIESRVTIIGIPKFPKPIVCFWVIISHIGKLGPFG